MSTPLTAPRYLSEVLPNRPLLIQVLGNSNMALLIGRSITYYEVSQCSMICRALRNFHTFFDKKKLADDLREMYRLETHRFLAYVNTLLPAIPDKINELRKHINQILDKLTLQTIERTKTSIVESLLYHPSTSHDFELLEKPQRTIRWIPCFVIRSLEHWDFLSKTTPFFSSEILADVFTDIFKLMAEARKAMRSLDAWRLFGEISNGLVKQHRFIQATAFADLIPNKEMYSYVHANIAASLLQQNRGPSARAIINRTPKLYLLLPVLYSSGRNTG
jgi:hypothetical protein